MKFVVDMNMSIKWVEALQQAGFEAAHWSSLGLPASPDQKIMAFAAANDATVLTRDLDFSAILAANGLTRPSVVHLSEADKFEPRTVARVLAAMRLFASDLEAGAIVSMAGGRARVRRLPILLGTARQ
jgi:predicted nuclease of predicted toxin-antitoxin system